MITAWISGGRAFLAVPLPELAPELILPDCGDSTKALASRFEAHGMEPQPEYTLGLRKLLGVD